MSRLVFCSFILITAELAAAASPAPDLHLISSSETGLSFSITIADQNAAEASGQQPTVKPAVMQCSLDSNSTIANAVISFVIPPGKRARLTSQSLALSGKTAPPPPVAAVDPRLLEVRLIEPVSVRGISIGKVVVPLTGVEAGSWQRLSAAEVAVSFEGPAAAAEPIPEDHFGRMLSQIVANWPQARSWGRSPRATLAGDEYNPFAWSTEWVRIRISSSGVYQIDRTDLALAGVDVSQVDPASFRVLSAGGKRLPVSNQAPRDSLSEIAIAVFDDDGVFSGDDFIMFYATGPDFWEWSDGLKYHQHPYSDRNIYYLTWGGSFEYPPRRMVTVDGASSPGSIDTLTSFVDHLHLEQNRSLSRISGETFDYFRWYWQTSDAYVLNFNLPPLVPDQVNRFRVWIYTNTIELRLNNSELEPDSIVGRLYHYTTQKFVSGLNQLDVTLSHWYDQTLTDYVEIDYRRPLSMADDQQLIFYAPADGLDGQVHSFRVAQIGQSPLLLDITSLANQRLIVGSHTDGLLTFSAETGNEQGRVYALTTVAGLREPTSVVRTSVDDIRSPGNRADLVIITHDNFYSQALEFAAYREAQSSVYTRVVKVSDIYAQFSGGLTDPVAIRDFLGYAFRNWGGAPPSYCLLVGDGTYDFRNNLGIDAANYVPPYIVDSDSTVSDENFAYFDQIGNLDSDESFDTSSTPVDRGVDIVIGRWPISSASEFESVAAKMKRYESADNSGRWRNLITLIADDQYHGSSSSEMLHTIDSEKLCNYIPADFDLKKIYAVNYPLGVGGEKPEAREDIIRNINSGTLLVNYVGHGNPNKWADEDLFRRTLDIPRLNNRDKMPLVFNASCSIGLFDDPLLEGMAEDLLSYTNGGAVGTVSATRLVYSGPNADFNQTSFYYLLGGYDFTIAEAVYVAKLVRQAAGSQINDRKYIYIGDPLTKLAMAPLRVDFESLQPDSLVALTATALSGTIRDEAGEIQSGFDGTAEISVFDDQRQRSVPINQTQTVEYAEYGPEIYRGRVDVRQGSFDLQFVVPKDITYGGRNARISCYAAAGAAGAAGSREQIRIGGINTDVSDTTGPTIRVYFANDPAKSDGAEINQEAKVTIELFDSLGINLSGEVGHAVEMIIDDDPASTVILNDSFTYLPGSYQEGTASTRLPQLRAGEHRLAVKAWDSANNSSRLDLDFNVRSESGLEIEELLCYPNPVVNGCEFSYVLTEDAAEVSLKVFTLSGIQIYSLSELPGREGYNGGIAWDGRDADGDPIANGVYLFQLSANGLNGAGVADNGRVTATGKLIIMK